MDLKFGDIQETALIPLAIKASETSRPNARIKDLKAKEIIDTLGVDVSKFDPFLSHEGVVEYFSRDQVKICLNMLCDSFSHGYLLAELHSPFLEKNSKHHDAVKNTNATFGWGTKSGKAFCCTR